MPYVFGNDFGGVASQRFATDQMNIGIQRDDAARRDAALAQQRAEYLAAQQQVAKYAQDQQQNQFNFGVQQQNRADVLAQNAATAATGAYQFGAQEKRLRDQADQTFKFDVAKLAVDDKRYTAKEADQKANDAYTKGQIAYKNTFDAIVQGAITEPGQVDSVPDLVPEQKAILKQTVVKANNRDLTAMAEQATKAVTADKDYRDAITKHGFFGAGYFRNKSNAEIEAARNKAVAKTPGLTDDMMRKLTWDEATQRYLPMLDMFAPPTPPFVMPGTNAPALPPTAGTGNTGYQFGPTPSPMPVPNTNGAMVTDYSRGGGAMPRPADRPATNVTGWVPPTATAPPVKFVYDPVARRLVPVAAAAQTPTRAPGGFDPRYDGNMIF